jgi:hypothetical protein
MDLGPSTKSFIREIVIVVVGVLIALVLQELVSNRRDRQRTTAIRASMHEEIADFAEVLALRLRIHHCITAKLDALDAALRVNRAVGPWRNVGRPPFFFSSQGAWNSSATDLLSTQLPPDTFKAYGEIYQSMVQIGALTQREQDHWIVLQSLEQQDVPVAGERRWRLLENVAGARNDSLLVNAIAEQHIKLARSLGVAPNGSLASMTVQQVPICRPLAKAPLPRDPA